MRIAEPEDVGASWLVAVTVTVEGSGAAPGAAYSPLAEIVPQAAPPHPVPVIDQLACVFAVPATVAAS